MWYREAQNSNMNYRWQTTDEGDALVISSNKTKDGFVAQPAIFILFEIEGLNKDIPFKKENLKQTEIINIFQEVQTELFKYPPGWITERLGNNFQIQIVLDLKKTKESQTEGYTSFPGEYVVLRKNGINYAIDHEIAHALDMKRISKLPLMNFDKDNIVGNYLFDQKDGTYMAPTEYGKTSNAEAFADAFKELAKKGIKYRLPTTTKENIDQNRLFDYVEKFITSGNYKTKLVDFGDNIQLNANKKMKSVFDNPSNDFDNQRIQTIVGGFQNAIDRFNGDKQKYGISLIQDKQKIKDIVEYLNDTQSEFFTSPASDQEIKLALDYLKEKIDKKGYRQQGVKDRRRGGNQYDYEPLTLEFAPKAIVDILNWMGKTTNIKKTPGNKYFVFLANGQKSTLSTQLTQLLDNYFKNGSRENLMPLNEEQSIRLNALSDIFKKNDPSFEIRDIASDVYVQLLNYGGVFPPSFSNPEEFLYYDYKITTQGYTLDTNSVERKIKYVIIQLDGDLKIPENQKPFVEQQVMKMIQVHAVEYKKLLDYKERDPKNPFPIEFIKNRLTPVNYFDLAIKAISKILTFPSYNFLNPDTKNINFLKIYNSDLFNANQKQQLLNFYRSEQAKRKLPESRTKNR
jgi:hypothetical protein